MNLRNIFRRNNQLISTHGGSAVSYTPQSSFTPMHTVTWTDNISNDLSAVSGSFSTLSQSISVLSQTVSVLNAWPAPMPTISAHDKAEWVELTEKHRDAILDLFISWARQEGWTLEHLKEQLAKPGATIQSVFRL